MKILPPALAFALGLALAAGAEPPAAAGPEPDAGPGTDGASGPVLVVVNADGSIGEVIAAAGLAEAIAAIESTSPATSSQLLVLLVPVADGCDGQERKVIARRTS